MHRYYQFIEGKTHLSRKLGGGIIVSTKFHILSSTIIHQCSFLQDLIQQIIYTSHGSELTGAKRKLTDFPSPKARFDYLCKFPYTSEDIFVKRVFDFSRGLFQEIYQIRNVLAHEIWSSSDEYPDSVLFSTLDENSRILIASGRMWHSEDVTPEETYNATIRFIKNCKVVTCNHLEIAAKDIDLCAWCLMNISNILNESNEDEKHKLRQAFLVFGGTSHLFKDMPATSEAIEYSGSRGKAISRPSTK